MAGKGPFDYTPLSKTSSTSHPADTGAAFEQREIEHGGPHIRPVTKSLPICRHRGMNRFQPYSLHALSNTSRNSVESVHNPVPCVNMYSFSLVWPTK